MKIIGMKIGETITSQIILKTCTECGCVLDDCGLCSFRCPFDGCIPRPAGSSRVQVFDRVDTLISEHVV
jgi:hypothetical protein